MRRPNAPLKGLKYRKATYCLENDYVPGRLCHPDVLIKYIFTVCWIEFIKLDILLLNYALNIFFRIISKTADYTIQKNIEKRKNP